MAKKLITVWLSLTILFSSISIFAYADSTSVQGEYLLKDVVINGQNILNYKLNNPIVAYNNYIYVPMDEPMGNLLGISATMDTESRTVYVTPKEKQWVDFCQGSAVNDLDNLPLTIASGYTAYAEGTPLDLTNRPVLMYGSVLYLPLNAIVDSGVWGWTLTWSNWTGAFISTDPYIGSYSYYNHSKACYKAGLAAYITKKNPHVDIYKAQTMVEYFETYGEIYGGLDTELLIAIAETESTFYETVRNPSGATGLMQVKTFVGAAYGFSAAQLYQMKPNIHVACILLDHGMKTFNGNVMLALSGYACGEYAVMKGNYSLKYYNNWVKKYFNIIAFASAYQV